jgi:penicillin amidase
VLGSAVGNDDARQAVSLLMSWDGLLSAESVGATVFEFFVSEMVGRIVRAKAPRASEWALGKAFTWLLPCSMFAFRRTGQLVRLLREQPPGWFGRSWSEEIEQALARVTVTLRTRFGADPNRWKWGRVRTLTLAHPFGTKKLLNRVFNRGPFPCGGDANTIAQAFVMPLNPTANPAVIPSLRVVVDLGNWDESSFSMPGGQSGNPLSRHYDDLLAFWRQGKGVRIAWSPEEVRRATRTTLRLVPS